MEAQETRSSRRFIHRVDDQPIFMAAIGSVLPERRRRSRRFLMVTAASRSRARSIFTTAGRWYLSPETAGEWMGTEDIGGREAEEIAVDGARANRPFRWHPVSSRGWQCEKSIPLNY